MRFNHDSGFRMRCFVASTALVVHWLVTPNATGGQVQVPSRAVALASDDRVIEKSGQLVDVGTLAREYGFTDVDGTQPPAFRITATK